MSEEELLQAFSREWPGVAEKFWHAVPKRDRVLLGRLAMDREKRRAKFAEAELDGAARQSFSHWGMH